MSGSGAALAPSPQQQAVRARAGQPTVLVAAAGSGKTRVLTWLFTDAHLQEGIPIERLLAITFTSRAAGELRARIADTLQGTALGRDPDLSDAWIGTFHGVCARLLREFAPHRGLDPGFSVIDELTAAELQAAAWEDALEHVLASEGAPAAELVAQVGEGPLRGAVMSWWTARRAAGEVHPVLPTPVTGDEQVRAAAAALGRAADDLLGVCQELRDQRKSGSRLESAEQIAAAAHESAARIAELVRHPPVTARAAANALAVLPAANPHRGAPFSDHPSIDAFIAARDLVSRRLGELVAAPRVQTVAELARVFSESYETRKRADECLDHDDLELEALQLLRGAPAIRGRLAERFARILVDEFQDTSPRQAELVELLSGDGAWTHAQPGAGAPAVTVVGDPRQAIYGFRYASVDLIRTAQTQAPPGVALQLSTNYRSDAELLAVIDAAWAQLDPAHEAVDAARGPEPLPAPRVELLITRDDASDPWDGALLGGRPGEESGAVLAEARLLASRIADLRAQEPDATIAVLARARRSLVPIAEALAALGIDAVQDGAQGFWERLEIADLLAWLRLVRNPLDDAALVAVLASPLAALSADGLALVGTLAVAGPSGERLGALLLAAEDERLEPTDAARMCAIAALLEAQRSPERVADPCRLLDEVIEACAYDEHLARLQGGARRLANLARLRRLITDEMASGGDLGSFVDRAASEQRHELRAPEAALGGRGAVQLMTVHQSKGLEFDTVVVAGLGSQGRTVVPALLGDDTRLGLKLRPAPGGAAQPLFDHAVLAAELAMREREELRRVLYVALTRAKERLLVSGVATWLKSGSPFGREVKDSTPVIEWLSPALVPDLGALLEPATGGPVRSAGGVQVVLSTPAGPILPAARRNPRRAALPEHRPAPPRPPAHGGTSALLASPPVLSYTALSRHGACGLRFYAEELLRLPETPSLPVLESGITAAGGGPPAPRRRRGIASPDQLSLFGAEPASTGVPSGDGRPSLAANTVGTLVHAVLEHAPSDLAGSAIDDAISREVAALGVDADAADRARIRSLVSAALQAPAWTALWAGGEPLRERAFTIAVGAEGHVLTGVVDAQSRPDLAAEGGDVLVVDYKTDRLERAADLAAHVAGRYALQRAAYALAALRAGAEAVRVVHLFLDGGVGREAELRVTASEAPQLEAQLLGAVRVVASGEARATRAPDAVVCDACPARGSLCAWPLALTQRPPQSGPAGPEHWAGDPAALRAS